MANTIGKDRIMKFPYTMTAKVAMFPYKFHYKHAWFVRWWTLGIILTVPVFYKITQAVNSPENVEKWREIRRKQLAGEH